MATTTKTFSLRDVMQLAGVKRSQVEYWVRQGAVQAISAHAGTGTHRQFNFLHLLQLRLARLLTEANLSAPSVKFVLSQLNALREHDGRSLWDVLRDPATRDDRAIVRIRFDVDKMAAWQPNASPQLAEELSGQEWNIEIYVASAKKVWERVGGPWTPTIDDSPFLFVNLKALLLKLEHATGDSL